MASLDAYPRLMAERENGTRQSSVPIPFIADHYAAHSAPLRKLLDCGWVT